MVIFVFRVSGPLAFVWPANQSRSARDLIYPDIRTSLLNPDICGARSNNSSPEQNPYLLVIVCSAVQNFEARYTIRHSWAQDTNVKNNVRVVFLVGQQINKTHQEQLQSESDQYGDIIQVKYLINPMNANGTITFGND